MKKILYLILPVIALFTSPVEAQNNKSTMTLKQAITFALDENTEIKKQNLAIIQSKYQLQESIAAGLPQINASAQFTDNLKLTEQLLPGEIFGEPGTFIPVKFGVQYMLPITARWEQILYNKAYFVAIEQSKKMAEITEANRQQVEQEIIYNVASSYYQTIIVNEQQNIVAANLLKLNQSVNVAQVQYDNQMIRKIDRDQLKVNETNTQADLDNLIVSYSQSLDMLKILIGYPLNDSLILTESIDEADFIAPQNSTSDNPLLSLIDKQIEMKNLEIKGINARYYPTLMGTAQYGYQTQFDDFKSDQIEWTSNAAIVATLSIPIFDGFQKRRQVQQRKIDLKVIDLDMQFTRNQLDLQHKNAVKKYVQTARTAENQKANYDLAQSVYDAVQTNYNNGLASLSDLINADSGLKGAQTQYLTALLQKKVSALDILRANGNMKDLITAN